MIDVPTDSFAELLELVVAAVGSGVLALGGLVAELGAVGDLTTGHAAIGVWELVFGALLCYAGCYLLGYRCVVPAIARREH